jgi:hypothetical protein
MDETKMKALEVDAVQQFLLRYHLTIAAGGRGPNDPPCQRAEFMKRYLQAGSERVAGRQALLDFSKEPELLICRGCLEAVGRELVHLSVICFDMSDFVLSMTDMVQDQMKKKGITSVEGTMEIQSDGTTKLIADSEYPKKPQVH